MGEAEHLLGDRVALDLGGSAADRRAAGFRAYPRPIVPARSSARPWNRARRTVRVRQRPPHAGVAGTRC